MYGYGDNSNEGGCLRASTSLVEERCAVKISKADIGLHPKLHIVEGMCITDVVVKMTEIVRLAVEKVQENIAYSLSRIDEGIQGSCGIVCYAPSHFYVNVTPQTMWLTESNGYSGTFEVEANIHWVIE